MNNSQAPQKTPKLYEELASWWPLLSSPADYEDEAGFIRHLIMETIGETAGETIGEANRERSGEPGLTLLELGSGGGNNASYLKAHFRLTLVDRSPGMLEVSRRLNPSCEHLLGDMRTLRLGRLFDAVFIHDAIMYMTTEADLRRAIATAYAHCRPGGVAIFTPDCVRESFLSTTEQGGEDGEKRSLRFLEWAFDPDPADSTYTVIFVYLLREEGKAVRVEHDEHLFGLFSEADWTRLISEVGFRPRVVHDSTGRAIFIGDK